tara:strand:- start:108 stop:623 length:516 start_codon:yes stop_codon:yes gene_type:complete
MGILSYTYNAAKAALKGGKGSGQRITKIEPNVPTTRLQKADRNLKLSIQRRKAAEAKLAQTNFEIANPKFSKGDFTSDPAKKNVIKNSQLRNKKSKEIFEASKGRKFNKGGRVGLKGGTFPDLNKDGKTTFADVLIGRGVLPKGKKKKTMAKKSESPMDKSVKKKNKKRFV